MAWASAHQGTEDGDGHCRHARRRGLAHRLDGLSASLMQLRGELISVKTDEFVRTSCCLGSHLVGGRSLMSFISLRSSVEMRSPLGAWTTPLALMRPGKAWAPISTSRRMWIRRAEARCKVPSLTVLSTMWAYRGRSEESSCAPCCTSSASRNLFSAWWSGRLENGDMPQCSDPILGLFAEPLIPGSTLLERRRPSVCGGTQLCGEKFSARHCCFLSCSSRWRRSTAIELFVRTLHLADTAWHGLLSMFLKLRRWGVQ